MEVLVEGVFSTALYYPLMFLDCSFQQQTNKKEKIHVKKL